ncbi:MAG: hypothetical protein H6765_09050 [Candidatus Peribacteria bacterium]|nr:MAG: hypothetical protein H6765_09050 [Candidatus Peribacteria bacterium]
MPTEVVSTTSKVRSYLDYISIMKQVPTPLSPEMFAKAASMVNIPVITDIVLTAIIQNETNLGIYCLTNRAKSG